MDSFEPGRFAYRVERREVGYEPQLAQLLVRDLEEACYLDLLVVIVEGAARDETDSNLAFAVPRAPVHFVIELPERVLHALVVVAEDVGEQIRAVVGGAVTATQPVAVDVGGEVL